MAMLEVKDLEVYYGVIQALKGISFDVDQGDIVALIGANGAGKTTTLHTITGLLNAKAGKIIYEGKDITHIPGYKLVSMGIAHVPEGRRVFATLSVLQNLMMGAYTRRDKNEIEETLKMIYKRFPRLEERKNQLAGTLSGGEQQMLAMGRALMSHPKVMVLDEPSMGLSPIYVNEIFDIIQQINKDGTTVLLVEQNAKKALSIANKAYVLETGTIALSGDVGFYSGARKLIDLLDGDVQVICGISSVVYFMAKIGLSWDDARIVSAHGRDCNLIALIRHNPKVFSILGTEDGVARLASRLVAYGMGDVTLYVGENLSYENEKIFHASAAELTEYRGDALSVVTACNEKALPLPAVHGICDEEFLRGKAPMTKEEVRTVSLSKLRLQEDSVCYDVGAGTGSVSVEMALRAWKGQVYAIEKKEDALALLKENRRKFATDNLEIVPGTAPEAMVALPVPTHAFIGGSSGNMNEIIRLLLDKNPGVRIVINCITLETVTEAMNAIRDFSLTDVDIVQLSAARSKSIGRYHMMMGENPIYIISCSGRGEEI